MHFAHSHGEAPTGRHLSARTEPAAILRRVTYERLAKSNKPGDFRSFPAPAISEVARGKSSGRNPDTLMRRGEGPLTTHLRRTCGGRRMTEMGHEERFPPTRLSAGCGFRKETIVGMRRDGRDAPIADFPALTPKRGGSDPEPPFTRPLDTGPGDPTDLRRAIIWLKKHYAGARRSFVLGP